MGGEKMTVLIVEGPDLSGKGTAIEKIAKHFKDGFLIKNLYKPTQAKDVKIFNQYWKIMSIYQNLENRAVSDRETQILILDRFFPSQAVYSYLRGTDEMHDKTILDLDEECANEGFIYVYLDTETIELQKRFDIRGDEHIKRDDLDTLRYRYELFWNQTKMHKIKINTMEVDWLDKLDKFIKSCKKD